MSTLNSQFRRTVSLVITSCGRIDLLDRTITSFGINNTYPIQEVIIIEDSGYIIDTEWVASKIKINNEKIKIITNSKNIGQIESIDLAYSHVSSEFIFHCEDDWLFNESNFIEASISVLDEVKDAICVWLRGINDTNGHPVEETLHITNDGYEYYFMSTNYRNIWSGFTFNPSLRRTIDAMKLHPFSKVEPLTKGLRKRKKVTESDLSIHYDKLGYKGVILKNNGIIKHIGDCDHIANEWENPIWIKFKNKVKKVIQITK